MNHANNQSNSGVLITFEGGEGGGKTTQIVKIVEMLKEKGKNVVALREPGGTVISEQIREVVLSAKNVGLSDTTEVLLFQAARAQIYSELVLPALERGEVVLMDRSRDSSVVYQGMVRGFGREFIEQLNDISTQKTLPNFTILLDVPVSVGLDRRAGTDKMDRLDSAGAAFHEKVRAAYLELAQEDTSGRWRVIDASQDLDQVTQAIWDTIMEVL